MKQIYLTLCLLMACNFAMAQFTLTPGGLRDQSDTTKNYVVLSFPDQSQDQIFSKIKEYVTITYKSPKAVLSEAGSSVLSINGSTTLTPRGDKWLFDMLYNITLSIKNERIKIEPTVSEISYNNSSFFTISHQKGLGLVAAPIYGKKGELKEVKAKEQIESFFNSFVENLSAYLKGDSSDNEW